MPTRERSRVHHVPHVEGLESRALLNGALPTVAEIHTLARATVIKGTIHGQVTSVTTSPSNPLVAVVSYTGQGSAKLVGAVSLTGHHTVTTVPGKRTSLESFSGGTATLTASGGTLDATYTGAGSSKSNGKYTATLLGSAVGTSGVAVGLSGTFVGHLTGNARTGTFTLTVTIRA